MGETLNTWSPVIQYGFAGFAAILLIVVVWLIRQLLHVLQDSNKVIEGNTQALRDASMIAEHTRGIMSDVRDRLLERPCLMSPEELRRKVQKDGEP